MKFRAVLEVELWIVNVITQDLEQHLSSPYPARIDIFGKAQLCLWRIHSGFQSSLTQRNSRGGLCVVRSMTQRLTVESSAPSSGQISADGCTEQVDRLELVD